MKHLRLLLLALSIVGMGACQSSIVGPDAGQEAPTEAAPSLTEGAYGSGG
jgi:hypothetical protein